MATKESGSLKLQRERIGALHAAGAAGTYVVRQLSDALDQVVCAVWERHQPDERCALIALGEYGRQELSPSSSLDLLILHPAEVDPTAAAKALGYELWGADLDLGYAVYTPEEALRLVRSRVDSELRFLDGRLLSGDAALFQGWKEALLAWSRHDPEAFLARLRVVTSTRRSSTDDACSCLEPDLMDGAGGLADLAALRWIEAVIGPSELPSAPGELTVAADLLHRVRNELHFLTGQGTDVLQMQYHTPVAAALADVAPSPTPEIDLLRRLYDSCRSIAFALDSVLYGVTGSREVTTLIDLFGPDAPGSPELSSEGAPGQPAPGQPAPGQSAPGQLAPRRPAPRWSPRARESFVGLLSAGPAGRAGFRALERTGALATALPEWDAIRCLPQRTVYHRYAVDVHCFEVVAELAKLPASDDELTRRVAREAEADREALLLAGLLHDVGKGAEGDHCIRGEMLAASAVGRMGIEGPAAEEVVWLVRNHLLLSRAATRRDIGDQAVAQELADRIGSLRRLRMLYLLTIADARATGPAAWSTWKASLIARLFTRVAQLLHVGDLAGADTSVAAIDKLEALHAALSSYPAAMVDHHASAMPKSWLQAQPLRAMVSQSQQMLDFQPQDEVRIRAVPEPENGVLEVTLVATDRPGLFSRMAGVLALHELNVLGAEVYTRADGMALEVFQLEAPKGESPALESLAADMKKALHGRLSLDARLAELRARRGVGRPAPKAYPPRIELDGTASEYFTVVEIRAGDRIGLLYTITRALGEMELDIHVAKVSTYGDEIVDVFYVRDFAGQKVTDASYQAEIERSIRHRLSM